ncbi:MAG: NAD(+)/NADH kinase [Actinobacteria bacterium]|nr:NAD(+)/NADH kinase [Actinomycetota bacterium]
MSLVLVVVHPDRPEAAAAAASLVQWAHDQGHEVAMSNGDAERASVAGVGRTEIELSALASAAKVAVSIGGDGTMLYASALVAAHDVPVLGINCGRLGYLTEVEIDQTIEALKNTLSGSFEVESRMRISLTVERADGSTEGPWSALNEGVLEKRQQGHTVHLAVAMDDHHFLTYSADGLIVATPTGSTAYSMSARGPIVEPTHRALLFTPVSPHTLFDRSLVLDPTTTIRITVASDRPAILSVDGRASAELTEGDSVVAAVSQDSTRLVTFGGRRFHDVLGSKFGLLAEG